MVGGYTLVCACMCMCRRQLVQHGVGGTEKLKNTWQEKPLRRQKSKQIMKYGVLDQAVGRFCEGRRDPIEL